MKYNIKKNFSYLCVASFFCAATVSDASDKDREILSDKFVTIRCNSVEISVRKKTLEKFRLFKMEKDFQNSNKKFQNSNNVDEVKTTEESKALKNNWDITKLVEKTFPQLKEDHICELIGALVAASEKVKDPDEKVFYKNLSANNLMWLCKAASIFGETTVMKNSRSHVLQKITGTNGIFPLKTFDKGYNTILYPKLDLTNSIYAIYSDGKGNLITGSRDSTATLWKIKTGKILRRFGQVDNYDPRLGHTSAINAVCLYGKDNFITGSFDHTAILWNTKTGKKLRIFGQVNNEYPQLGHTSMITSVCLDSKSNLITGSMDHTTIQWDTKTGNILRRFGQVNNENPLLGHVNWIRAICVDNNGNLITGSSDHTAIQWDTKAGKIMRRFGKVKNTDPPLGHTSSITSVCLDRKKGNLITCSHQTSKAWSLDDPFKAMNIESVELCYKLFTSKEPIKIEKKSYDHELFEQLPSGLKERALENKKMVIVEKKKENEDKGIRIKL